MRSRLPLFLLFRVFIVPWIGWSFWVAIKWNHTERNSGSYIVAKLDATNGNETHSTRLIRRFDPQTTATIATRNYHALNQRTPMKAVVQEELWNASTTKYHRWNDPKGISVTALIHRFQELLDANQTDKSLRSERQFGPIPAFIVFEKQQQSFNHQPHHAAIRPVTPVLKLSWRIYFRRVKTVIHRRLQIVGPFVQDALYHLETMHPNISSAYFPALYRLYQMSTTKDATKKRDRIMIPMLWRVDDFRGCDHQNYHDNSSSSSSKQNISLPHFTLSASPSCPNAFCLPSYSTMELTSTATNRGWSDQFTTADQLYPWSKKVPLAVWRGSFTGAQAAQRKRRQQPRYQLAVLGKQYPHLLDVAVSYAEAKVGGAKEKALRDQVRSYHLQHQDKLPYRLAEFYMNFSDFQRYRAVIDVYGNSWSERFPKLLCSNSVVIKVHPGQVDYFWPALVPHVHYLPANLQNLTKVVTYAVADKRQEQMQAIVRNARHWCQTFMTRKHLHMDILSILNGYVEELDRNDLDWHRYLFSKESRRLEEELAPFVPPAWEQNRTELL